MNCDFVFYDSNGFTSFKINVLKQQFLILFLSYVQTRTGGGLANHNTLGWLTNQSPLFLREELHKSKIKNRALPFIREWTERCRIKLNYVKIMSWDERKYG